MAAGKGIGRGDRWHRSAELRAVLDAVDAAVPADREGRMRSWTTPRSKASPIRDWLAKRPRYHPHFTPTARSWLNQVERCFALLTARRVAQARGVPRSGEALEAAGLAYVEHPNTERRPSRGVRTTDRILASVGRFGERTLAAQAVAMKQASDAGY